MFKRPLAEIGRFFTWWGSELAACLPGRLRGFFKPPEQNLRIEIGAENARFSLRKGKAHRDLGAVSFPTQDPAAAKDEVRRLLRGSQASYGSVVIDLQRGKALHPIVQLPLAAAENLKDVLSYEMDRHTPFKADHVYYDFRVLSADSEQQRLSVEMLVAARDDVEQAVDIAKSWGFEPACVAAANTNLAPGEKSYNLLPVSQRKARGQAMKRLSAVAAIGVVALVAVAVYLPLQQREAELDVAQGKLNKIRVVAERASALKKQVGDLVARNSFVVDEKRQIPTAVEILDVVTRVLPDNTWLLQLVYRDGTLRLSGYSQAPSSLIRLLEKTDLLKEVRFSSPVTMDPRLGRERFNIIAVVPDKEIS